MSSAITFVTGIAYGADRALLAASPDDDPPNAPYSVWYVYIGSDPAEPWTHYVNRWWPSAATRFVPPEPGADWALVGLSNEGELDFNFGDSSFAEKIPGAGVWADDANRWGYMSALKQIGQHLYACGGGGQVYKRIGPDNWLHIDDGVLQAPDTDQRLLPRAIDGPSEAAVYLVGGISVDGLPPFAKFWNGLAWRDLQLPAAAERITNLYIENESRIWMCGANGTLLLGNAQDGFRSLSTVDDNQLFLSLCKYRDRIYLASNVGLFVYDPAQPATGIRKVVTGLQPELQDANVVDSVDQVLWSIGPKDIARFDGQHWERIHHPDNPRIGGTAGP